LTSPDRLYRLYRAVPTVYPARKGRPLDEIRHELAVCRTENNDGDIAAFKRYQKTLRWFTQPYINQLIIIIIIIINN